MKSTGLLTETQRELSRQMRALSERGIQPVCTDPAIRDAFVSEWEEVRARVARECRGCLLLEPCGAAGAQERWGIWGGRDRTRLTSGQRKRLEKLLAAGDEEAAA